MRFPPSPSTSSNVPAPSEIRASGTLPGMPVHSPPRPGTIIGMEQAQPALSFNYRSGYHGNLQTLLEVSQEEADPEENG